jgi:glycosyltransferase involved in cell wall biosynthesis
MPPITALLHTENDALRLGRCLETLYPCDHILIVDHGSGDGTVHVAREYGAQVVAAAPGASPDEYLLSTTPGWILSLDPRESLTESLAASLFELKDQLKAQSKPDSARAFSVFLREESAAGWLDISPPQTRLVPHAWNRWKGGLPIHDPSAVTLEGELLRFNFP